VILLTEMVAVETYEIAKRTFTGHTPGWSKELVLLSMVWMGCLGSAVLYRQRGHITLEFLVDRKMPSIRRWILLGGDILVLMFSLFLAIAGAVVVLEFLHQSLPGTRMPVGVSYLPLPVTGVLLVVAALEHIAANRSGKAEEQAHEA